MKKMSKTRRILSLLFAVAMVITMIPLSVVADIGDLAGGGTGVEGNAFLTTDSPVNLPIKIYDYLNDGMLFEYAEAGHDDGGDVTEYDGSMRGGYAQGAPFPTMKDVIGNDYTGANRYIHSNDPFEDNAFHWISDPSMYSGTKIDTDDNEVNYTQVGAEDYVAPQYMHLRYRGAGTSKSAVWVSNFARDNKEYYKRKQLRYAVIVYRTNSSYNEGTASFFWSVSPSEDEKDKNGNIKSTAYELDYASNKSIDISKHQIKTMASNVTVPASTQWRYLTVNMSDDSAWDQVGTSGRVSGVGIEFPLDKAEETMDISHIAYFETRSEAEAFGNAAAIFANDPGVDLRKRYFDSSTNPPTVDIGLDYTNNLHGNRKAFESYKGMKDSKNNNGTLLNFSPIDISTVDDYTRGLSYLKITGNHTGTYRSVLTDFVGDEGHAVEAWKMRYCAIVYRAHDTSADTYVRFYFNNSEGDTGNYHKFNTTSRDWQAGVFDLSLSGNSDHTQKTHEQWEELKDSTIDSVYIRWPKLATANDAKFSMDISHIAYFATKEEADAFAAQAVAFAKNPGIFKSDGRGWNFGNNRAYGMLRGSNGGDITVSTVSDESYIANGKYANTYSSNTIGGIPDSNDQYGVDPDGIYFVNLYKQTSKNLNLENLDMTHNGGYQLLSTILKPDIWESTHSIATVGLLNPTLNRDKRPTYNSGAVKYIARILQRSLCIPQCNTPEVFNNSFRNNHTYQNYNYNYNYVKGTPDGEKYGYTVTDKTTGETSVSYTKPTGDNYTVVARDLAQAIRDVLSKSTITNKSGVPDCGYPEGYPFTVQYLLGDYPTEDQQKNLIGSWKDCEDNIHTCHDAAYFLLNNLFVPGSYNQPQDQYNYLVLQPATINRTYRTYQEEKEEYTYETKAEDVYIFDGGFSEQVPTDPSKVRPPASIVEYNDDNKTIGNAVVDEIDKLTFSYNTNNDKTTYYPFTPITASNTEAGMTYSPYFVDDGVGTRQYYERDFNYVLVSNGQFVYREEDDLYFEFEGDDDVYLFINGQLVLDIGGAHGITKSSVNINDYVTAARNKVADGSATDRDRALALVEGNSYDFDFYYMERHGYGANMRIATNIRVVDSALSTDKTAYQQGTEINDGGIIDETKIVEYGFAMTNQGNAKLYNLAFNDVNIGVSMTPEAGLNITGDRVTDASGNLVSGVCDLNGGVLEATDLVAYVDGFYDWESSTPTQPIPTIEVRFADNDALKAFLQTLQATGTDSSDAGLWPYATVTFRGIGYKLTADQITEKRFDNTLVTSAMTAQDGSGSTLFGEDSMRVLIPGTLQYYQWAGKVLQVTRTKLKNDIVAAAGATNSSLASDLKNIKSITNVQLVTKDNADITTTPDSPVLYSEGKLNIQYKDPGSYVFYIKITYDTNSAEGENSEPIPVLANVTNVVNSVFVLDYGLKVDLTQESALTAKDSITVPGRDTGYKLLGVSSGNPMPSYGTGKTNTVAFTAETTNKVTSGQGEFHMENDKKLTYTPTNLMDTVGSIYLALGVYENSIKDKVSALNPDNLDINNEVQMYKQVSVLPANVVYYEDDFAGDMFFEQPVNNQFVSVKDSTGSGDLFQQVDQDQEYGQDKQYQNNSSMSGDSLKKIKINSNEIAASFTFKGTGLELISRTNAYDSASILMTVKDKNGVIVKRIPVITQFDNGNNGGKDEIYQVPVIRVKDLAYDTYTVEIQGVPARDYSKPVGSDGKYPMKDVYLYVDGIRIFEPLGPGGSGYYNANEQGAAFKEIRDLLLDGVAYSATYNEQNQLTISTGLTTWTENLLGSNHENVKYEGNTVAKVNDYLMMGPNNEVYMNGTLQDMALFFKVKKSGDATVSSFQIAVRAIDQGMFQSAASTDLNAVVQYCVKDGDGNAWAPLATVTSGTEQYYAIDLNRCPVDGDNIIVAVRVNSGMASFTSIKHKGLDLVDVGGAATNLTLVGGTLCEEKTNLQGITELTEVDPKNYPNFQLISTMMSAETLAEEPDVVEPEEPGLGLPDFQAIMEQIKAEFLKMLTERLSSLFSFIG